MPIQTTPEALPRFFAVVLNWKRASDTLKTVASLQQAGLPDECIVLVDNETSSQQETLLRGAGEKVVVLPQKDNLGYAGGNNVGLKYALEQGAEAVLVLNNDAEIAANAFIEWGKVLASDAKVGIVGAAIFDADSGELHNVGLDEGGDFVRDEQALARGVAPIHAPHGCAMVLRAELLREVGLLDEQLFLMGEETDLAGRARAKGWQILVAPRAMVFHEGGASFGGVSPLKVYYSHRNTLRKWQGEGASKASGAYRARYDETSRLLVVHWVRQRQWGQAFAVAIARRDALRERWGKRRESPTDALMAAPFVLRAVLVELVKRSRKKGSA
jgi:GT2 family glycosyltransferase